MFTKISVLLPAFCILLALLPVSAQEDLCLQETVISSFADAAIEGTVDTWSQNYLNSDCPANVKEAVQLLAQAHQTLEETPSVAGTEVSIPYTGEYAVITMKNALGIESEVEVSYAGAPEAEKPLLRGQGILVEVAPEIYLTTPLREFRFISLKNDVQMVGFSDGQAVSGKVYGIVTTPDGTIYDLSSATEAYLVSLPETLESTPLPDVADATWTVHISSPVEMTYTGANPHFIFRYYSSAGYIVGGDYHNGTNDQFYATLNNQEILARFEDFEEILFPGGEAPQHITLTVPDNEPVKVDFRVEATDSKGSHDGSSIHFVMDIAGTNRSIIIPVNATTQFTLTKN